MLFSTTNGEVKEKQKRNFYKNGTTTILVVLPYFERRRLLQEVLQLKHAAGDLSGEEGHWRRFQKPARVGLKK